MIPIKDENPTQTTPVVTYLLVAANILVFLYWAALGGPKGPIMGFALVPREIITGQDLTPFRSPDPIWLTVFTSMFLHGGVLHIAGNMLYLWIFGNNIEEPLGHVKYALFYVACGVVAALAHIVSAPDSVVPTVGASGAIAGVLGAYLVLYPDARIITIVFLGFFVTTIAVPAVIMLGYWFLIQVISAQFQPSVAGGGVAYMAHIGGFLAGVVLILALGGRRLARRQRRIRFYRQFHEQ